MTDASTATQPATAGIEQMRWYHTIELPDGRTTPGEYDLRPVMPRLPMPASLEGKRCIDVGSRDGFYAFEMERRGASEVVSIDIDDPGKIAMPAAAAGDREMVAEELAIGNRAFELARDALGSEVKREMVSVYELDPATHGSFDFAMLGSLLIHLRDPVGALTALRGVTTGDLLVNDAVGVNLSLFRRRAVAEMYMVSAPFWWMCNPAGLRRMVQAAGFRVLDTGRPYLIPHGRGPLPHKPRIRGPVTSLHRRLVQRRGGLHAWVLATAA